jgi:large subunit ribosomal protein L4
MAEMPIVNIQRKEVGKVDLPDGAFDYPHKRHLVYEAVRHYLATGRAGTHKVKSRVEVRGGGRKPWRQKGTGRARAGTIRSPLWKGGGIVHGPTPRDYGYAFPKKARRRALASALSTKRRDDQLMVIDDWSSFDTHKTKDVVGKVRGDLGLEGKVLLVYDGEVNPNLELGTRNHPELAAVRALQLHAYHVLDHDTVVMSRAAAEQLGEVLTR